MNMCGKKFDREVDKPKITQYGCTRRHSRGTTYPVPLSTHVVAIHLFDGVFRQVLKEKVERNKAGLS